MRVVGASGTVRITQRVARWAPGDLVSALDGRLLVVRVDRPQGLTTVEDAAGKTETFDRAELWRVAFFGDEPTVAKAPGPVPLPGPIRAAG